MPGANRAGVTGACVFNASWWLQVRVRFLLMNAAVSHLSDTTRARIAHAHRSDAPSHGDTTESSVRGRRNLSSSLSPKTQKSCGAPVRVSKATEPEVRETTNNGFGIFSISNVLSVDDGAATAETLVVDQTLSEWLVEQ